MKASTRSNIVRNLLPLLLIGLLLTIIGPWNQQAANPVRAPKFSYRETTGAVTSAKVEAGAVLSSVALDFGYQQVGTTSAAMTETITNSDIASVTITDISLSGRDHYDFTCDASLPLTVVPASSVAIHFYFSPALPWRAGTREATAKFKLKDKEKDALLSLTGIGATCGGPLPSCSSGCADSDDDGLNDAWESAGGIDVNNDGQIDATNDVLLPGADPNRPDVYLKYDYMVATNTSPIGTPPHTHQPPEKAIQQVVEAFASHGVALHIDPQHDAIPEVLVTTLDPNPTKACAGDDFVTMRGLRQQYFGNRKWAYHYAVFGHDAVLPDTGDGLRCPQDKECLAYPDPLSSGSSELPGSSFIVAFGADVDEGFNIGVETVAGTFMHELGHNFGLKHGSLAAPGPQACMAFKPNYVSVMDYMYQTSGIGVADGPGSNVPRICSGDEDCPTGSHCTDDLGSGGGNICYRVDYSRERLLDLNESDLNETIGVGGPSMDTDLVNYIVDVPGLFVFLHGASFGPIDWNGNGQANESSVQVDIDNDSGTPNTMLLTANDWENTNGFFKYLNFKFQCTTSFARDSGAGSAGLLASSTSTGELSLSFAREHHMLYPPAAVTLLLHQACSNGNLAMAPSGVIDVAILGTANFDVSQVELASLKIHGARPAEISVQDVNNDRFPDLVLRLNVSEVRSNANGKRLRVTGWLNNSRAFAGETEYVSGCSH